MNINKSNVLPDSTTKYKNTRKVLNAQQNQSVKQSPLKNITEQNKISNKENRQKTRIDKVITLEQKDFPNQYIQNEFWRKIPRNIGFRPTLNYPTKQHGESDSIINTTINTLNETDNMSNITEGNDFNRIYDSPVKTFLQEKQPDIALQSPIQNSSICLDQTTQQEGYVLNSRGQKILNSESQKELEQYLLQKLTSSSEITMYNVVNDDSIDGSITSFKQSLQATENLGQANNIFSNECSPIMNEISFNESLLSVVEEQQAAKEISASSFNNESNINTQLNQNTSLHNTDDNTSINIQ